MARVTTTTGSRNWAPSPQVGRDGTGELLSAEKDVAGLVKGPASGMLTLNSQLRAQSLEDTLHSLLLHVYHERSEADQIIELVNECSDSVSSLSEGDELLREFVPLR